MRRIPVRLPALVLSGLALLLAPELALGELVDRVAAVVNNEIITLGEVTKRASADLQRSDQDTPPEQRAKKHQEILLKVLDTIIDDHLLDQEVKEAKIVIDEHQVDAGVQDVMKRYNLNADQLATAIANEGLTLSEYRDQMRKQLGRFQLMREKVAKLVKVTDSDIRSEYDRMARDEGKEIEVHIRHIVVSVPENAPQPQVDAAFATAQAIAAQARQPGVDFIQLAKEKSQGSSAADGGDLGFFRRGAMVPAFEKVAFNLKVGDVSDPVRTSVGWHVLKLEERRAVGLLPIADLKPQIEEKLRREQSEKASQQYVKSLRLGAVVEIKLGPPAQTAETK